MGKDSTEESSCFALLQVLLSGGVHTPVLLMQALLSMQGAVDMLASQAWSLISYPFSMLFRGYYPF